MYETTIILLLLVLLDFHMLSIPHCFIGRFESLIGWLIGWLLNGWRTHAAMTHLKLKNLKTVWTMWAFWDGNAMIEWFILHWLIGWLIGLVDGMIDCLNGWLTGCLIDWFLDWLVRYSNALWIWMFVVNQFGNTCFDIKRVCLTAHFILQDLNHTPSTST